MWGSVFYNKFFEKHLTNRWKYAAFLLSTDSKKALVIRSVPTLNYKEACKMLDRIKMVKRKMDETLEQLCEVSWMFSKNPGKDFTRNRKIPFSKLVSFLLAMEGGTLTTELLKRFDCSLDAASASAFVQPRSKLAPETFTRHALFQKKCSRCRLHSFCLLSISGTMPLT